MWANRDFFYYESFTYCLLFFMRYILEIQLARENKFLTTTILQ